MYALQQFYEVEHRGQLPQRPPPSSESSLPLIPTASFRSRALREQGQQAVKQGERRKEQEEITCKRQARDAEIAAEPPETDEPITPWHENELSSSSKRKGKKKRNKKALSVFAEAVQAALKEASASMITEVGVLQGVFKVPAGFGMDEETHIIDCPATIASSLTALHQTLSTELQVQKVTKARALRGDGDQFMCSEDRVFDGVEAAEIVVNGLATRRREAVVMMTEAETAEDDGIEGESGAFIETAASGVVVAVAVVHGDSLIGSRRRQFGDGERLRPMVVSDAIPPTLPQHHEEAADMPHIRHGLMGGDSDDDDGSASGRCSGDAEMATRGEDERGKAAILACASEARRRGEVRGQPIAVTNNPNIAVILSPAPQPI